MKGLKIHLQNWIRLNAVEGIGIARKLELLRMFKTPEALFEVDRKEWIGLGLRPDQADSLLCLETQRARKF